MADSEPSSDQHQSDPPRLSELLDRGWKTYEELEDCADPPGSSSFQLRVRTALTQLQEAARMVEQLELFSRNEDLEEVSTTDLRYLLLPALRGALTLKITSREQRLNNVRAARDLFMDFLSRCKDYQVSQFQMPRRRDGPGPEEEQPHHGATAAKVKIHNNMIKVVLLFLRTL